MFRVIVTIWLVLLTVGTAYNTTRSELTRAEQLRGRPDHQSIEAMARALDLLKNDVRSLQDKIDELLTKPEQPKEPDDG